MKRENPTGLRACLGCKPFMDFNDMWFYLSHWDTIINHSEIILINEMSINGLKNQAFSSDTGQMPMTVQPNDNKI